MKNRNFGDVFKNVVGTMFLLAGAGFVCSTLLSMRAVFADPIAPTAIATTTSQASTARGSNARASGRPATARGTNSATVARTATGATAARTVSGRPATASRVVTTAPTATAATARANASTTATRGVSARTTTGGRTIATRNGSVSRNVVARTATNPNARVSLSGSAIRGSKANTTSTAYTYLSNKLYTGNYSNIVDPTTGLISADAYNNCMESYYTCMDEICTARNAAQRRCACAGRVKAFAEAETALESANEELIKVSGELALLIANKGKDVSEAFQLTDAEKVMNCVSWKEMSDRYNGGYKYIVNGQYSKTTTGSALDAAVVWCEGHGIYDSSSCSASTSPNYCKPTGNTFDFNIANLDGSSSDILASLQSWANAKEQTLTIVSNDMDNLTNSIGIVGNIVNGLSAIAGEWTNSAELKDSLAETWGYELFEYAHNNVCNRVLDSCFNGIYEACGTPPSTGRKCTNGAAQCPYNYNSMVSVSNTGTYELNFVTGNSGYTASNSATCFGYASASGDPYSNLRGPVADARRSILQKYALDANADCDAYGEQLRTTAQNIGYQKVAAQQALQQKRLEFINEEKETTLANAITAGSNFNDCINEILECYETQVTANASWSTSRIRTYCAQVSNAPHCYETMICNPSNAQFKAVIDKADSTSCKNTADYKTNTCRNIVTLNDILNGTGKEAAKCATSDTETCDSAAMREQCLKDSFVDDVRSWKRPTITCADGTAWNPETERCEVTATQPTSK